MSPPRLRRTVAVMPWDSSRFWKAATRRLGLYGLSTTSFSGMRFTWPGMPRSFLAMRSACQSLSLTPSIMAYSKLMRRPVFSK